MVANATICEIFSENNAPRIRKLIPNGWLKFPAIEPAIPSHYLAGGIEDDFETPGEIIWGCNSDVEGFSKNQNFSNQHPIFILRLAGMITQTGPDSFSGQDKIEKMIKEQLLAQNIKIQNLKWGEYPVLAYEYRTLEGILDHVAIVGLNNDGWAMIVNLHASKTDSKENEKHLTEIWTNFLLNSKQLEEPEYFTALGMEMKDGYTNYQTGTAFLKVFAERRRSDDKIAVMVCPKSPGITFKISDVADAKMGSKWKYREPCTKVYGTLTEKNENMTNITESVITILTKDVDNFSFDLDPKKHPSNVTVEAFQ